MNRIALIGIIINQSGCSEEVNRILHDFSDYIVGRMGIPYRKANVCIISVVVDAPCDVISALSGKLGMITGANVKTLMVKNDKQP